MIKIVTISENYKVLMSIYFVSEGQIIQITLSEFMNI
jgi:hypothetical protein